MPPLTDLQKESSILLIKHIVETSWEQLCDWGLHRPRLMKNLWEHLPFNSPGLHLEHFGAANMPGWQEKMHANIKRPRIISPSVSWLHCFTDCSLGLEIMLRLGAHCVPGAHSMALIAQQFRNGISLMTSWHCSHRIEPTSFFFWPLWKIFVGNGHSENRALSELMSPLLLSSLTLCR